MPMGGVAVGEGVLGGQEGGKLFRAVIDWDSASCYGIPTYWLKEQKLMCRVVINNDLYLNTRLCHYHGSTSHASKAASRSGLLGGYFLRTGTAIHSLLSNY